MLVSTQVDVSEAQGPKLLLSTVDSPPTTEPAPTGQPSPTTPPSAPSITVSITASGTNTAGETYSLVCSATVTGSTDQPTITWLDDDVEISNETTRTVTASTMRPSGDYSSTLTFDPLVASHSWTYTCRATVGGAVQNATEAVTVQSKCMLIACIIVPCTHA